MAGLAFDVNIPSKSLTAVSRRPSALSRPRPTQRRQAARLRVLLRRHQQLGPAGEIQLARPTAGTLTAGGTAIKCDAGVPETVQSTVGLAASVEPTLTASLVFKTITVHPQLGYEFLAPLGQEEMIAGGTNCVFSANAPATVNIRGYMKFEE